MRFVEFELRAPFNILESSIQSVDHYRRTVLRDQGYCRGGRDWRRPENREVLCSQTPWMLWYTHLERFCIRDLRLEKQTLALPGV